MAKKQKSSIGRFSENFPRTFEYLKTAVPILNPQYITKSLPDPKIILLFGSNEPFYMKAKMTNVIIINVSVCLEDRSGFNPETFADTEKQKLLITQFDANKTLQQILIHEYEHILQSKGFKSFFGFSTNFLNLFDKDEGSYIKAASKTIQKECKSELKKFRREVPLFVKDIEVEARLTEWIFLLVHDQDIDTIKFLDDILFRPLNQNYQTRRIKISNVKDILTIDENEGEFTPQQKEYIRQLKGAYTHIIKLTTIMENFAKKYASIIKEHGKKTK